MVLIVSLFSFKASATITFVNPAATGASNYTVPAAAAAASPVPGGSPAPTGPTTATFYYSNISANTGTNTTGETVYVGNGGACNKAINPNCLIPSDTFTLSVTSTQATSNSPQIYLLYCSAAPTQGNAITTGCTILNQQPYTNGAAIPALTTTWANICTAVFNGGVITDLGSGTCVSVTNIADEVPLYIMADYNQSNTITSEMLNFNVWFDSVIPVNSVNTGTVSGLYDFLAFPGDTQIIIQNPSVDSLFSTGENNGVGIQFAKFYYYPDTASGGNTFNANDFANIPTIPNTTGDANVATVGVTATSLSTGTISNLVNGTRYYIQAALVDFAGNIGYQNPNDAFDDVINHSAVPDQIVGLISQNGHCFIATAAFGTPLAGQVQTLRRFRDKFLMPHKWGRNFVSWYYFHSPEWASYIAPNDGYRAIVRAFLYPVVGFSWLALHWGLYNAIIFSFTLLLLPLLILRQYRFQMKAGE